MKPNYENEVLKRKYAEYLKEARGLSSVTVNFSLATLSKYDKFSKNEYYSKFNVDKAIAFKEYLKKYCAITSYRNHCKRLQKFFIWLVELKGYKSKITKEAIDYLRITNKDEAISRAGAARKIPTLEYVVNLVKSIPVNNEIDKRDRALIAFTACTGMRDSAIASLPIGCVDIKTLIVNQNPKAQVKTKFSKHIISKVFNFDSFLMQCVLDWYKYLEQKGFGQNAPLFPRSKVNQTKEQLCYKEATNVEPEFWHSGSCIRSVFKKRTQEAKLEYYAPHTYRHLAIRLALEKARTAEEKKAVSQNFGHEHIATTFATYGNLQPDELANKLTEIDSRNDDDMDMKRALEVITKGLSKNAQ